MTTNSVTPELYEVWRLAFEYEDQPGVAKERPVIIGAFDEKHVAVLVVKVTGHGIRNEFPGEARIEDWREAGLVKPSVARCAKTLIVPLDAFRGAERYGRLSERDAEAVAKTLRDLNITI